MWQPGNEPIAKAVTNSRREFLTAIGASFASIALCDFPMVQPIRAAESITETAARSLSTSSESSGFACPFLLDLDTYCSREALTSQTMSEMVRIARDVWQFGGIELPLSWFSQGLPGDAGGITGFLANFSADLEKVGITSKSKPSFRFSLRVNLDPKVNKLPSSEMLNATIETVKALPISSCSIATSETIDPGKISAEIAEWHSNLNGAVSNAPQIILETPAVSSGIDLVQVIEGIGKLPSAIGLLIRSNTTRYRFDLAIHDMQLALRKDPNSQNFLRDVAARFRVSTAPNNTDAQMDFEREMFRRALVEQLEQNKKIQKKPLFVSIGSTDALKWTQRGNDPSQIGMGSKTFRDAVISFRRDLESSTF